MGLSGEKSLLLDLVERHGNALLFEHIIMAVKVYRLLRIEFIGINVTQQIILQCNCRVMLTCISVVKELPGIFIRCDKPARNESNQQW